MATLSAAAMPIMPEAYYALSQCKAINLGDATLRNWRRNHVLKVEYVGRTAFVKGAELIRCIEETATDRWDSSPAQ